MNASLVAAVVWVLLGTFTAFLSMRRQFVPGVILLVSAPILIIWLSVDHGWWIGALALAAFVSMFRNPLKFIWAKLRGQKPTLPPEFDR